MSWRDLGVSAPRALSNYFDELERRLNQLERRTQPVPVAVPSLVVAQAAQATAVAETTQTISAATRTAILSPSSTVTIVTRGGPVLVMIPIRLDLVTTSVAEAGIFVDGADASSAGLGSWVTPAGATTYSARYVLTQIVSGLAAGSHSFAAWARLSSGSAFVVTAGNRELAMAVELAVKPGG